MGEMGDHVISPVHGRASPVGADKPVQAVFAALECSEEAVSLVWRGDKILLVGKNRLSARVHPAPFAIELAKVKAFGIRLYRFIHGFDTPDDGLGIAAQDRRAEYHYEAIYCSGIHSRTLFFSYNSLRCLMLQQYVTSVPE